jgi:hypothetical protein
MKLNFSFSELLYSNTAEQYRIKNIPDLEEADNLLELIVYCLQPIRDKLNKPMIVSSGYRCEELNNKIGGVKNSQHTKGQAVDFKVKGMTVKEIINFIVDNGFDVFIQAAKTFNAHEASIASSLDNRRDSVSLSTLTSRSLSQRFASKVALVPAIAISRMSAAFTWRMWLPS